MYGHFLMYNKNCKLISAFSSKSKYNFEAIRVLEISYIESPVFTFFKQIYQLFITALMEVTVLVAKWSPKFVTSHILSLEQKHVWFKVSKK